MSGLTPGISKEKGGVQVREMMESSGIGVAVREPTAGRRPRHGVLLFSLIYNTNLGTPEKLRDFGVN